MRLTVVALLTLLAALAPAPAGAQGQAVRGDGSELTVYLMTMGAGDFVWERFGHNAIWVRDDLAGTDVAYNYGMFSFDQDGFLLRFVRGHMDYWMEGFDADLTARAYVGQNRSVWAQELNLTPAQRAELRDFLEWNARPENRVYRYDYYRDNCSTRVRDAIDRVLGGQLRAQTEAVSSGATYRDHTRRLTADDALVYTGLLAGLGQPVDREISVWEEMFLPLGLRERLRQVTVDDGAGGRAPLVRAEIELYASTRGDSEPEVPTRLPAFLVLGVAVGGALAWAGMNAGRTAAAATAFAVLGTAWSLIAGLLGVVLLGLWLFTDHATSAWNENVLLFNPLLLGLAVLIPTAVRGRRGAAESTARLALAVAGIALAAAVFKVLPWFSQVNGELIALALPVNLGLAAGLWALRRASVDPPVAGAREKAAEVPAPA